MKMIKKWKGIPRLEVRWNPSIDDSKCSGCGKCVAFCSHKVYRFDEREKRSRVALPFECTVGCSSCMGVCEKGAISFPHISTLTDLLKTRNPNWPKPA
ncbi:MAG: 4Fe-4S binding protein [Elusimicrobia bacterium]|nr:4Fe-4S binding protein [Elusimicrobiota bacterium]